MKIDHADAKKVRAKVGLGDCKMLKAMGIEANYAEIDYLVDMYCVETSVKNKRAILKSLRRESDLLRARIDEVWKRS